MDVYIYVIPAPAQLFRISSQLLADFSALLPGTHKGQLSSTSRALPENFLDYKIEMTFHVEERADMSLSDNPHLMKSTWSPQELPPGFFFLFSRLAS